MLYFDGTLIVQVILFLLFFAILNRIFYQPMSAIYRRRAERVEAGQRAAEEAQRAAEEAQRQTRRRLDEARAEAQRVIAAANGEAASARRGLLDAARQEADALVRRAQEDIQRERQTAVETLRREAGSIAVLVASKAVGRSLDTRANQELAARAIADAHSPEAQEVGSP